MINPDRPQPGGDHTDVFTPREALMRLLAGESKASKVIEALNDLADWRRIEAEIVLIDEGVIEGSEDIEALKHRGDMLYDSMASKRRNPGWGERYDAALVAAYAPEDGIWNVYKDAAQAKIERPAGARMRPLSNQAYFDAAVALKNDLQSIVGN